MSNVIEAKDIFAQGGSVADLRLLCCPGAEELTNLIDRHLMRWAAQSGMEQGSLSSPASAPASRAATPRAWSRIRCGAMTSSSWWTRATTA